MLSGGLFGWNVLGHLVGDRCFEFLPVFFDCVGVVVSNKFVGKVSGVALHGFPVLFCSCILSLAFSCLGWVCWNSQLLEFHDRKYLE